MGQQRIIQKQAPFPRGRRINRLFDQQAEMIAAKWNSSQTPPSQEEVNALRPARPHNNRTR